VRKIKVKQKVYSVFARVIFILGVVLFDIYMICGSLDKSMFMIIVEICITFCIVKSIIDMRNELYSLELSDEEVNLKFYLGKKMFQISDIGKVYCIAKHKISYHERYGLVRAIGIVIGDKIYVVSELYDDFDLLEEHCRSNFLVQDVNKDDDIVV